MCAGFSPSSSPWRWLLTFTDRWPLVARWTLQQSARRTEAPLPRLALLASDGRKQPRTASQAGRDLAAKACETCRGEAVHRGRI